MYKPSSRVMLYEDVINQMMTLIKKVSGSQVKKYQLRMNCLNIFR